MLRSLITPRKIRLRHFGKTGKITSYPVHPDFVIELDFLGRVRINFAENACILLDDYLAELQVRATEQVEDWMLRFTK
jgi:hypothetical protein